MIKTKYPHHHLLSFTRSTENKQRQTSRNDSEETRETAQFVSAYDGVDVDRSIEGKSCDNRYAYIYIHNIWYNNYGW